MLIQGTGHVATGQVDAQALEIDFLDGKHVVSEAMVAHLGGTDEVKEKQGLFKSMTFEDCMRSFWKLYEQSKLNEIGRAFRGR